MRLRYRVVLSMLSVVAISGGVSALVGGYMLWRRTRLEAENRVGQDLNAAYEFYNHRLKAMGDALHYTALGRQFRRAVAAGDLAYVGDRLETVRREAGLDLLTLTDEKGTVILRAHRPERLGGTLAEDPLLRRAVESRKTVSGTAILPLSFLMQELPELERKARIQILPTPKAAPTELRELNSAMFLCSAAPVFQNDGLLAGMLWAGTMLNRNYELVDRVQNTVFRDERFEGKLVGNATVFQNDVRISTNVRRKDGSRGIGTRVSAEVFDHVLRQGKTWVGPAWVLNDWYISAYAPIRDVRGEAIGMLYVGALQRKFDVVTIRTFTTFALVALAGLLVAALVAWRLANGIARPVGVLARASAGIAEGDFSQKLPVESDDELGSLTHSFNTMVKSLKERDQLLNERTRQQLTRSERLASIGRLAAGVAHEINNPLTGVLTFSHMLLRQLPEQSDQHEDVQTIIDATVRCRDIVRGLLNFARQSEPQKTLARLDEVLGKAVALTQNQAAISQVNIVREMDPELGQMVIDAGQIQEVAVNMIVNAIDAMPDGGDLYIRTRAVNEGGDQWAEFEITDTGCGIPPENLDHVFDPFFTTKQSDKGTGLGLALSYGIVMEHGGQINLSSEVGRGTTIVVRLPCKERTPTA